MSVNSKMKAIADPLRELSGTSAPMSLDDMATRAQEAADETDTQADLISQIVVALSGKGTSDEGGNVLLQSKTAEPSESVQKIEADSGYDGLSSVTIGAVSRTYIGSGVTKKAEQTYTPGTTSQTIASGQYLSGTQTIKGDADLAPENIRVGVEIFGVSGTYAGEAAVLQEKIVTPSKSEQSVTPDSGYDGLSKVTVSAMPTAEQATPSISVSDTGLIMAVAEQGAGYVSAGTKSARHQMITQTAKTVTPSTSEQTAVASGRYTTGEVKVRGDTNLLAENIKSGVSIFDVLGTFEGEGGDLPSGVSALETGSFTVSEDISTFFEISHNLGVAPNFAIIIADGSIALADFQLYTITQLVYKKEYTVSSNNYGLCVVLSAGSSSGTYHSTSVLSYGASHYAQHYTTDKFRAYATTSQKLKSGATYNYIIGVHDSLN